MLELVALPYGHFTAITYLIVLPDQVILVDPTAPVRRLPSNLPPISRILATHGHIDHIYQPDAGGR
jgi:glyoxylase-like metal-dependent hydrolase (beta-lactamase superfamily II)